ncbi:MAG: sigma-70 family RNA polymerase sigma factor, partial [Pyrinomonadaceae bacterium]
IREAFQPEGILSYAGDENIASGAVRAVRTDFQLIELVLSGDENAFEQIFDRHKRFVARTAARYFQRPEQIEEIIQIAFAKAFVELPKFRGEHELSLPSWLGRIAANACLDTLRSQKRKPEDLQCELTSGESETILDLAASTGPSSEESLISRDLSQKLLAHLPEDDRALLQMLYVDEMSVVQIGDLLGWSVSKVKIRAWRARHSLRKVLKKYV